MGMFLRYFMALIVHLVWQRSGQRGAVPPMRIPIGKGRKAPLPALAPWQIAIAAWMLRQLWDVYGGHVKHRLTGAQHPVARHVGTLLPDPGKPISATTTTPMVAPAVLPAPVAGQPLTTQKLPKGSLLSKLRHPGSSPSPPPAVTPSPSSATT